MTTVYILDPLKRHPMPNEVIVFQAKGHLTPFIGKYIPKYAVDYGEVVPVYFVTGGLKFQAHEVNSWFSLPLMLHDPAPYAVKAKT